MRKYKYFFCWIFSIKSAVNLSFNFPARFIFLGTYSTTCSATYSATSNTTCSATWLFDCPIIEQQVNCSLSHNANAESQNTVNKHICRQTNAYLVAPQITDIERVVPEFINIFLTSCIVYESPDLQKLRAQFHLCD